MTCDRPGASWLAHDSEPKEAASCQVTLFGTE
jgi:hypothetical protein